MYKYFFKILIFRYLTSEQSTQGDFSKVKTIKKTVKFSLKREISKNPINVQ